MSGSPASASADAPGAALLCGVNWIGDAVMSMPAVQALRRLRPGLRLAMLAKPRIAELWRLHGAPDEVLELAPGIAGVWRAAMRVRRGGFARAWVMPHSIRSALVPFLAGVPERTGLPGPARGVLMTRVVRPADGPGRGHQMHEYLDLLLGPGAEAGPDAAPRLAIPPAALDGARRRLAGGGTPVALMPGAARGPSKRWPADRFAAVGRRLAAAGCRTVVLGAPAERELCAAVARDAGPDALNLAGGTTLAQWAALLACCRAAVTNDSGGMHLAAAVGTPVVAVYGRTDPARTGPLGAGHAILQHSERRSRDVGRDDPEAVRALEAVTVDEVVAACLERLGGAR